MVIGVGPTHTSNEAERNRHASQTFVTTAGAGGAENMSHAGAGMANAMSHVAANGANGNKGMAGAVANAPC